MKHSLSDIELLAPAGGMEQLQAAVLFGADAVYLAVDRFGMRARAINFSLDTLHEAISYAHNNNVKVYATCNTLMIADDIDALPKYLRALDQAGTDALVISDIGAFTLAREYAPHVALHVSTQASVANAAAARAWYNLGARRIVCAREMSLSDIARMREDIPDDLEIEVFVHGSMCMAISGRCLISACLTGRSANAGDCSQPCRWEYVLEEETRPGKYFPIGEDEHGTFILNAKDLNMIEHLDALADAGVNSIKIEGRNKKAFYVATVVNAYRRVLDGADPSEVKDELLAVSHRPYGTGFYFGEAQQATDFEGYDHETLHVADILGCETAETTNCSQNKCRILTVRCRNHFEEGDQLEILSPHRAVEQIAVRNLEWLKQNDDEDKDCDESTKEPKPVEVANRACELYRFVAEELNSETGFDADSEVTSVADSAATSEPDSEAGSVAESEIESELASECNSENSLELTSNINSPVQAGSFLRKRL